MNRRSRILKQVIADQPFTTAVMQQVVHPESTEALALSGVDFVIIDLEHTGRTIESALPCLTVAFAYDFPALVRVYEKSQHLIEQALDAGAQGVLVPTVETAEDCREIVRAGKFAPLGERGFCPVIPASRWLNDSTPETYLADANRDTFLAALVETPKGFDNLESMLSVDGIDAFFFGAADYATRIGRTMWDDEVSEVMRAAVRMITDAGKLAVPLGLEMNVADLVRSGTKVVQLGMNDQQSIQWRIGSEVEAMKRAVLAIGEPVAAGH